jgi:hypothetical protein
VIDFIPIEKSTMAIEFVSLTLTQWGDNMSLITLSVIQNNKKLTLEAVRQPYKIILRVDGDVSDSLSGIVYNDLFEVNAEDDDAYKKAIEFLTKHKLDFKVNF